MAQSLQNQITYAKSMNGIVTLSDGAGSTISNGQIVTNDLSGNTISSTTINATTLNTTDTNITGTIDLKPVGTAITISNSNFAVPTRSLNTYSAVAPPYGAIASWGISLISGSVPTVYVGRGFTDLVNTYETLFPEYPLFTQYLSFQGAGPYQMNVTQSLTFASTGNYILTMYGWGQYNLYQTANTVSVTCGNGSLSNFSLVEQNWTKIVMKFQITTAGANTLTISIKNTTAISSGLSISGIQIVKQSGLVVYDGTNTNNQLITTKGLYTNGFIYNKGLIQNFGTLQNFGPLSLYLPYSSGSLVIGSSTYGSSNSSDTGKYSVIIGQSNVVYSPSTAIDLDSCIFIGYGAGEQTQQSTRNHAIGYQSLRWASNGTVFDNVGYGYQTNTGLGYGGGFNYSYQNTSIGNFAFAGAFGGSNIGNTVIGYGSLGGVNFDSGRSYNSICGANSLQNIASNFNCNLGYNNANSIVNTGSDGNIFIGHDVGSAQSGSSNVLTDCTFIGNYSDVSAAGNYARSVAIGYYSRIEASDCVYLGTAGTQVQSNGNFIIIEQSNFTMDDGDMTLRNASRIILQNKRILEEYKTITAGAFTHSWQFGQEGHIVVTGTGTKTIRLPAVTTTLNIPTQISISCQNGAVITIETNPASSQTIKDLNNGSVTSITFPANVSFISLMAVSTLTSSAGDAWQIQYTSNPYAYGLTSSAQNQLIDLQTKTTNISYSSSITTVIGTLNANILNASTGSQLDIGATGTATLNLGATSTTITAKGSLITNNGAQKTNGYTSLSGTGNTLSKPLSEYYNLTTGGPGSLTLPVIDADMYGSQVTFLKLSTDAVWTINAGSGNTFRLYKSNSTAITTSISMAYNFTVLRIVATQSTVWDVIVTDIFYNAASDWVVGTRYFPMLMNPTNITASINWNVALPTAFYGQQGFSITATAAITLPQSTNVNIPDGLRIKFRRVGGTAQILNATASGSDVIMANNALVTTAAGTAVLLVAAAAFWGEIYLNKTTATWYCQ
jgi:hypothetical protein